MMSPRCCKPVRRKEQGGIAVLEDPVCGRPEGHPGPCRSAAAWARALLPRSTPQPCDCGCGELTVGWGPCKTGHHMRIREAA